jgi:hypothetical protein
MQNINEFRTFIENLPTQDGVTLEASRFRGGVTEILEPDRQQRCRGKLRLIPN